MRAFIIGNGPSLAVTPLDLIAGEVSFACNHIDLIYDSTSWRPTHYVRGEYKLLATNCVELHLEMGISCHVGGRYKELGKKYSNYHKLQGMCGHGGMKAGDLWEPEEWHMPMICQFGGSVPTAMQVALNLGYDELVLLGCDLGYESNKCNHFHPDYPDDDKTEMAINESTILSGHECGIRYHKRRGLSYNVINATVGGKLELYPRARLEDLL